MSRGTLERKIQSPSVFLCLWADMWSDQKRQIEIRSKSAEYWKFPGCLQKNPPHWWWYYFGMDTSLCPYQLPWQYFLHIFRLFITLFALFHLLSNTLWKQHFHVFHTCLWLVMWSETLAALGFPVLKQYCSRPRKWSNLNQAVLTRLSTLGRYQAMNCTSVYNDKQIS